MANKQVRDTVFRDYFNEPHRLLSLGNALLNIAELFKNHVATMKERLYSTELIKLPTPEFYVFYDGTDSSFDHQILRLSDSFEVSSSKLELEVHCYNLNDGKSQQIKQRCQFIYEYSRFSNAFKNYRQQGQSIDNATRLAVEYCKEHNVMSDYLTLKESEVLDMFGFEWNEEDFKKAMQHEAERREARGIATGKIETTITTIKNLMKNMNWSAEAAMAAMGISKTDYGKYLAML